MEGGGGGILPGPPLEGGLSAVVVSGEGMLRGPLVEPDTRKEQKSSNCFNFISCNRL